MSVYFRAPGKRRLHKMNRRQHKKLHLGEFQTLIFGIQGRLNAPADDADAFDRFMDDFIDYLEAHHLEMAGGGDCGDFSCVFQNAGAASLGETEKSALIAWLVERDDVAALRATPLVDGFYDSDWENYSEIHK